jgi:hypothetical protein
MGASDKLGKPREGLGEMTNWTGAQPLRQRNHRMTRRELMLLLGSARPRRRSAFPQTILARADEVIE